MNQDSFDKFVQITRQLVDIDNMIIQKLPLPKEFKDRRRIYNEDSYSLLVVIQKKGTKTEILNRLTALAKSYTNYMISLAKILLEGAVLVLSFMAASGEILIVLIVLSIVLFILTLLEKGGKFSPEMLLILCPMLQKVKWGAPVISKLKLMKNAPKVSSINIGSMATSGTISNMQKAAAIAKPAPVSSVSNKYHFVGGNMKPTTTPAPKAVQTGINSANYSMETINISKAASGSNPFAASPQRQYAKEIFEYLKKVLADLKVDEKMRALVETIKKMADDFIKAWNKAGDTNYVLKNHTSFYTSTPQKVMTNTGKAVSRGYQSPYTPQVLHEGNQAIRRYTIGY